ncbi:hypothetical protein CVT25_004450 [Psilocybe cyanescens]|uniref:non-specific serine/threonine protein kinase n=1 Tax=Psilocybe cyanescens TaxID=93625 RepID=A0A409X2F7_PSICY|nr:hypothetical protein CVT25_004450 [Psilocybe cyanescens]
MSASSASAKLLSSSQLISQGSLTADGAPVLFKYRFKKQYRHATLDGTLTKARVAGEVRALLKCLRSGVNVPGVRMVDATEGLLGIEWIEGQSVKRLIPSGAQDDDDDDEEVDADESSLDAFQITIDALMRLIGIEIAKMHLADIIHGDLTTSNMMLRHPASFHSTKPDIKTELVLIDFGLSYHSSLVEDKAVDLYVLERAFASTHPDSEPMFASVLSAYATQLGKEWPALRRRLDDVRLRGRKRSMVG